MNFLREIINSCKSGFYSGKGDKYTRKREFEKALQYYIKSLEYSDNDGADAVLLECISRSYARLGNNKKALDEAEKAIKIYIEMGSSNPIIEESIKRVSFLFKR